jgi:hypothetical protein
MFKGEEIGHWKLEIGCLAQPISNFQCQMTNLRLQISIY